MVQWTISFAIISLALAAWRLVDKATKRQKNINRRLTAIPGDSLIEQSLPLEIIEHVLSSSDPASLLTCRYINKYWHVISTNSLLENKMIEEYQSKAQQNLMDLLKTEMNVNIKPSDFISYSEAYPKALILHDIAQAQLDGKQLVALEENAIERLAFDVYVKMYNHPTIRQKVKEFWIKTMAKSTYLSQPYYNQFEVHWRGRYFTLNDQNQILAKANEWNRYSGPADIIISPKALEGLGGRSMEILMFRPRLKTEFIFGLIPVGSALDSLLFALLALIPCLFNDYVLIHNFDPRKSTILHCLSYTMLQLIIMLAVLKSAPWRYINIIHWIIILAPIYGGAFYTNFLTFLGGATILSIYIASLVFYMQLWPISSKRMQTSLFFSTLLLCTNDWTRTFNATMNGRIYIAFAKWSIGYVTLLLHVYIVYIVTRSWHYKSETKGFAIALSFAVLIMSVYFPL